MTGMFSLTNYLCISIQPFLALCFLCISYSAVAAKVITFEPEYSSQIIVEGELKTFPSSINALNAVKAEYLLINDEHSFYSISWLGVSGSGSGDYKNRTVTNALGKVAAE